MMKWLSDKVMTPQWFWAGNLWILQCSTYVVTFFCAHSGDGLPCHSSETSGRARLLIMMMFCIFHKATQLNIRIRYLPVYIFCFWWKPDKELAIFGNLLRSSDDSSEVRGWERYFTESICSPLLFDLLHSQPVTIFAWHISVGLAD